MKYVNKKVMEESLIPCHRRHVDFALLALMISRKYIEDEMCSGGSLTSQRLPCSIGRPSTFVCRERSSRLALSTLPLYRHYRKYKVLDVCANCDCPINGPDSAIVLRNATGSSLLK